MRDPFNSIANELSKLKLMKFSYNNEITEDLCIKMWNTFQPFVDQTRTNMREPIERQILFMMISDDNE